MASHCSAAQAGRVERLSSSSKPASSSTSAAFSQAGGRSSATTSATGLNTLNWWRWSSSVQNATTVSSGGQPGSRQATSATRIAASSGSLKRARVQSRTRSSGGGVLGAALERGPNMRTACGHCPRMRRPLLPARALTVFVIAGHRTRRSDPRVKRRMDPRVEPSRAYGRSYGAATCQSMTETSSVAEKVLAAVRTGPSKTEIREYPMPDIPEDAALMKMEVAGICGTDVKLYKTPPTNEPGHHGPREHRHHRQGRPRVHPAQGLQGRRPRLRRALRHVRQVRVVPPRPVPPLREHRLAHQPGRHPLRLHLGREARRTCGAASRNTSTCRGTRSCTTCRRASRRSSPAW